MRYTHGASQIISLCKREVRGMLYARLLNHGTPCPTTTTTAFPFRLSPDNQWCGNAQGESEPLEDRFMEFAGLHWGNRVYASMLHSLLCDPRFDLCDPGHAVRARGTVKVGRYMAAQNRRSLFLVLQY